MNIDTELLCGLLVESARTELMPRFNHIDSHLKTDGSLVTEADLAMQRSIKAQLNLHYPRVPLLGEEMPSDHQADILDNGKQGFWCLDPLDGTSNYVAGMPCFAVSLAYIINGQTQIGIVYDPVRDELFHAVKGAGAWLNHQPLKLNCSTTQLDRAIAMVDFKRLASPLANRLATDPPYLSQRSIGSVALDWCWLAAGRLQLYLHGGAKLWDYAAGTLIFEQAGGHFRLTKPHVSQSGDPKPSLDPQMAMGATNSALFDAWNLWLAPYQ
ncbi:MAG: inositol monophosphatase family protein [Candidatus Thiodiazotropha sp.]|nr:inositol monophosphatase family protein [Candidatus Thiodiazotropha sp.]MCM8884243.1 inositol monophosphatase family protein [Candidatus Thiodiazotropha sp.]MCM8919850.1 inositol monophosphatase family protein [Candidatus Thiodiazotropha sp.]